MSKKAGEHLLSAAKEMTEMAGWKARAEKAERERDEAIRALSEQSRLRGEAEGKLAALEIAGVVDGWKSRAEAAEARVKELQEEIDWFVEYVEIQKEFDRNRLTVTEEKVDRVMDAMLGATSWRDWPEEEIKESKRYARAALTAALENRHD